jgi:nucleotide-binding universal stress UspA family protein
VEAKPTLGRILLAVDGEPHSAGAVQLALDLAQRLDLELVAVHIKDPYLKQFVNEIYAQGRQEYLDHVDDCLDEKARQVHSDFVTAAQARKIRFAVETRQGDPMEELLLEAGSGRYDLMVLGRKNTRGLARWRSGNLSSHIVDQLTDLPVLIVPNKKTG